MFLYLGLLPRGSGQSTTAVMSAPSGLRMIGMHRVCGYQLINACLSLFVRLSKGFRLR